MNILRKTVVTAMLSFVVSGSALASDFATSVLYMDKTLISQDGEMSIYEIPNNSLAYKKMMANKMTPEASAGPILSFDALAADEAGGNVYVMPVNAAISHAPLFCNITNRAARVVVTLQVAGSQSWKATKKLKAGGGKCYLPVVKKSYSKTGAYVLATKVLAKGIKSNILNTDTTKFLILN